MQMRIYKSIAVLMLVGIALIAGCDRHLDSREPTRSLPDQLAAPVNLVAQLNDRSVTLSWEMTNPSGVSRYRVYRAATGEDFMLQDSATVLTAALTRLPLNQSLRFRVAAVNSSGIEGKPSAEITVTVGLISIVIENNDKFTGDRSVSIRLNAPGSAEYVLLSEDSMFNDGAATLPYSPTRTFELSQGDGLKTVYARFTFDDGSESGDAVSDDITLDTEVQIESVTYSPSGQTFFTGQTISFFVDGGEVGGEATVSFPGAAEIRLADNGTGADVTAADGVYSAAYVVPVGLTVNNGALSGHFTDAAGNDAVTALSAQALDIKATPVGVQLTQAEAMSSWQVDLRWSESASEDFSSYRLYRATSSSVSDVSELLASFDDSRTVAYTDTTPDAATEYFYRVYVIDNSGLRAGSNVDSATTPVNSPPEGVTVASSLVDSTTVLLSWTRNNDDDFESYRIYRDDAAGISLADDLIAIITEQGTTTNTHYLPSGGPYYYRVFVFDRQGLSTSSSNEVSVP